MMDQDKFNPNNVIKNGSSSDISKQNELKAKKLLDNYASMHFPFCDNISKYEILAKIGQGTFGEVFKARNRKTQNIVALKKILITNEKEGFPITAVREIKILTAVKHENVVNLIEVCRCIDNSQKNSYCNITFYLVFEFCEHDLAGLLCNANVKFTLAEIKMIIKQLLKGLFFIHCNKILHRDMKASNILLTKEGTLKIADFGLSRAFSIPTVDKPNKFTNKVITLWYRPPELLLGERNYCSSVDMWGAGCIMAEMWTRNPLMQGITEQHQLKLISNLCGSINPESLPGVEKLELYNKIELPSGQKRKVKERLRSEVQDFLALDLIDKLLIINPAERIDCDEALNHDVFWTDPMPEDVKLEKYAHSNFEWHSKRNLMQARNIAPGPVAPKIKMMDEYFDRVF